MIYFDNAATTFKKPRSVYSALNYAARSLSANPHRSSHKAALLASEAIYDARESVALLFNSPTDRVVFTYNATYALNMAIRTLIKEKCHLLISDLEHNSVYRVVRSLNKELGVEYSVFDSEELTVPKLSALVRKDTKAIISTLASNVTGKRIDERLLSDFCEARHLELILDASQAAGHRRIDLGQLDFYALCAPGHKALFGISGSGFVIFKERRRLSDFIVGGSGSDSISDSMPEYLPEGYEAGTLGVAPIITLGVGCKFVKDYGEDKAEELLDEFCSLTYERLVGLKGVKIYGRGSGIISFAVEGSDSFRIAEELDKSGIAVRGGLHCAPLAHKKLGTLESGLVRVSFSVFNRKKEIDKLYYAMKKITEN